MISKLDDFLEKHLGISFKDALAEQKDTHQDEQALKDEKRGPQGPFL